MAAVKWCLICATANPRQHKQALWMVDGDLMCQECRDAAPAGSKIVRLNANGEIERKSPVAADPAPRRVETVPPRPYTLTGPKCAHPDCERRLRSDNSTGRCSAHSSWRAAGAAVATMTDFGQVAAKMAAAGYVAPAKVLTPEVQYVPLAEVPSRDRDPRLGRIGRLYLQLLEMPKDRATRIECHNSDHAGKTYRSLIDKLQEAKVPIEGRRMGAVNYFQWAPEARNEA